MVEAVLHHMQALGAGWVAAFVGLDLVAIICAALALRNRQRRFALIAFLVSLGATIACVITVGAAVTFGLAATEAPPLGGSVVPSERAKALAGGISVAMNGAAFGAVFTLIAALAALTCFITMIAPAQKRDPSARAN